MPLLFKEKVKFLWHVIDSQGIHTDPDKIKQVQAWTAPLDVHDGRVSLGPTSDYRRLVRIIQIKPPPIWTKEEGKES